MFSIMYFVPHCFNRRFLHPLGRALFQIDFMVRMKSDFTEVGRCLLKVLYFQIQKYNVGDN